MTNPQPPVPTPIEVAQLEAEWRRLERQRKPGKLRAYVAWQQALDRRREAQRQPESDAE